MATAGATPAAAKPVGADHNGLQLARPEAEVQFVWPLASKANRVPAPLAKTLFPSTTGGVAGPKALPSGAMNTGRHVSSSGLQLRTPLRSKPTSTGAAPATTTKMMPEPWWMAGAPPTVEPAGNAALHTTAELFASSALSTPSASTKTRPTEVTAGLVDTIDAIVEGTIVATLLLLITGS